MNYLFVANIVQTINLLQAVETPVCSSKRRRGAGYTPMCSFSSNISRWRAVNETFCVNSAINSHERKIEHYTNENCFVIIN